MDKFIEKNFRLLRIYCVIAQIVGWCLLLSGIIGFAFFLSGNLKWSQESHWAGEAYYTIHLVTDFFAPGLLAFVISQFLAYLIRPEIKAGHILHLTDMLCYLYACVIFIEAFILKFWLMNVKFSVAVGLLLLFPVLAKVLLLVGIGMILNRLLPVIEESKTLV